MEPERQFGAALGRIPSGIFILTVDHAGKETGMLASWVQQCSFKPPRVSLALQPGRGVAQMMTAESRITINILEASQTDMVAHFGKGFAPSDDAFVGLELIREPERAPILAEALAYLECRFHQRVSVGDHDLFVLDLLGGKVLGEGQPMTHIRKNGFHY